MAFIDPDTVQNPSVVSQIMDITEDDFTAPTNAPVSAPSQQAFVDPDTQPTWAQRQMGDVQAVGQTLGSLGSAAALSIPAALQATGNWLLTGDVEKAKEGMNQWMKKGYMPSNPLAARTMQTIGEGYEYLAEGTEKLLGPEARMATEIGLVAAPFIKLKPTPLQEYKAVLAKPVDSAPVRKGFSSDIIDSVDVRLLKNAPDVAGRVRQMEAEGLYKGVQFKNAVDKFEAAVKLIEARNPELAYRINDAYYHQPVRGKGTKGAGISEVRKLMAEEIGPKRVSEILEPIEAALRQRGIEMLEVNPKMELIPTSYLPLRVLHPDKLGVNLEGKLGKTLQEIDVAVAKGELDPHTAEIRRTKAITSGIDVDVAAKQSGHEKSRKYHKLTDEQKEAYATIPDALRRYFEETGMSIAEKKFLGKGDSYEAAIGEFMQPYANHPRYTAIREALEARFGPNARRGLDGMWNNLKEIGYIGTIADVASAIQQLTDIAGTMSRQGLAPTLKSIYKSSGRQSTRRLKGTIEPEDIGFVDIMAEMATSRGGVNKLLEKTLGASGFKMTDKFGKRVLINAAKDRLVKQAKNRPDKLREDYWWMDKSEFERFKRGVVSGDATNKDMQFALVNEVLDIQPLTLSQMPIKYLQMRNGKILYALKTWAIRQINRYREDVIKGNPGKALKYGAAIYLATESIDLSKDVLTSMITGVPLSEEDVADGAINNLLRMFFMSTYGASKFKRGDTQGAITSSISPVPAGVGVISDLGFGIWETITGEAPPSKAVKRIPIVGRAAGALMEE